MTQPIVSICIPTYNRAPYLRHLLASLARQIRDLKHSYEIIIADNGSTDDTESAVREFTDKLSIEYIKRPQNYGGEDNRRTLLRRARGIVQLIVADDDDLIVSELSATITQMLDDPSIVVVYAPWRSYNRATGKSGGNFYPLENNLIIQKGEYETLLALTLKNHVFPEIYVVRSDILAAASLFSNSVTYWAFVHATEFLSYGKIAFRKNPFYISISKHFESDNRSQLGHNEVQDAWDCYRGGLEYILSRIAPEKLPPAKLFPYVVEIQKFIALRMNVALRLRIHTDRNPLETYYLSCRLRGMGYPQLVPAPFDDIRCQAIAYHVVNCLTASDEIDKIVCVDDGIPAALYQTVMKMAKIPVIVAPEFDPEQHTHAIVLSAGSIRDVHITPQMLMEKHIRLFGVVDLLQKFS